jgi:Ca2+-binding RTX toxin-like protein
MPVTPITVVTGDATITADGQSFRQSGPGPQTLEVNGDSNTLTASTSSAADTLIANGTLNVLRAGNGADMLSAYGDANTLVGGSGANQQLYAAGNESLLVGGRGANQSLTVDGNDSVLIALGTSSTLLANGNNELLVAGQYGTHSLTVFGNDSQLIGGAGANTLTAYGNNNVLVVAGCSVYTIAGSYGCGPTTIRTAAQYRLKADYVVDRVLDEVPEIELPDEPSGCYYSGSSCGSYSVSYLMQWSSSYQNYDFNRCLQGPDQALYLEGNDGILVGGGKGSNTIAAMGNNNLLVAGDYGTQTLTLDGNDGTVIGGGSHGLLTVNGNRATMQAGSSGLQELTLNGNDGTMIGGGKHDILTANGNRNTLYAGENGVHFLTVNGNDCTLIGGGGTNLMTSNGEGNLLEAGWGVNYLVDTGTSGTYRFERGDGKTTIMNGMEGNSAANTLEFADIRANDLWLRRQGNDLRVDVRGSSQSVTLDDWFAAAHHELAVIRTADGGVLENGEVGALVQAMAGSSPFYNMSNSTMQNALAAAWDA